MKTWLVILLTTFSVGWAPAQKRQAEPPFKLTLTTENSKPRLGSDVWVEIQWTNTSNTELNADRYVDKSTGLDLNYVLDLRDSEGHAVPKLADKSPIGHLFDAQFGVLKPGEEISNDINLRRIYDLKQPGKYTFQVSRRTPKALGDGIVKSNIITITVTK